MNIFHKNGKQSTTRERREQTQTFIEYKLQNQVFLIISLKPHSNSWVGSETMSSRLRIWACHFSLASYLSSPLANTPLTLYEQFKNTFCSNLFKDSKATWGRSVMEQINGLRTGRWWEAQGIHEQPPVKTHLSGPVGSRELFWQSLRYHLMIVSLYKWISGG